MGGLPQYWWSNEVVRRKSTQSLSPRWVRAAGATAVSATIVIARPLGAPKQNSLFLDFMNMGFRSSSIKGFKALRSASSVLGRLRLTRRTIAMRIKMSAIATTTAAIMLLLPETEASDPAAACSVISELGAQTRSVVAVAGETSIPNAQSVMVLQMRSEVVVAPSASN